MNRPEAHRAQMPQRQEVIARGLLFSAVAGVLLYGSLAPSGFGHARQHAEDEIIAHVPARSDPSVQQIERLRALSARAPQDMSQALTLARAYLEASRREGDPRFLGAAEAAIAPFTRAADPVPEVRVMRATILQARHEFDAALRDLDRALEVAPGDAQAWLTRATVWTVKGGYEQAAASCARLEGLAPTAIVTACRAPIDAIRGQGEQARAALERALASVGDVGERAYLSSLLGELTFWAGDRERSEAYLRTSLELEPADRYTRCVYADLLLDQGRAAQAFALVSAYASDDALALRAALAALVLARDDASKRVARLRSEFDESRLRGDAVHRREEARLKLALGESAAALDDALESWAVQHEPWDARLVLEAAARAENPRAAGPVLAWLEQTGFAAPRLRALAAQLAVADGSGREPKSEPRERSQETP